MRERLTYQGNTKSSRLMSGWCYALYMALKNVECARETALASSNTNSSIGRASNVEEDLDDSHRS